MAVIPKPKFPNVPQLPGVPQLLRSPLFPAAAAPILLGGLALGQLAAALNVQPVWGLFDSNGDIVIQPDSVVDFGYRNGYTVGTYQVQRGNFAAYDKVSNPYELEVRMTKGGTENDRKNFIADIEGTLTDAQSDPFNLMLYTLRTPERSYENVTLERYELDRRGGSGANFIDAYLYFKEIRQVSPQYTATASATMNAQNPAALPPENQLRVQPEAPGLVSFDPTSALGP